MTLKMKGKTDVTAGRAMAARRGVGRVHHLDARFSWLQWFLGRRRDGIAIPAWRTQRGRPEVEEDRFDFVSERNTPSTTNKFNESELTDGGSEFPRGLGSKRLSCVNLEREKRM